LYCHAVHFEAWIVVVADVQIVTRSVAVAAKLLGLKPSSSEQSEAATNCGSNRPFVMTLTPIRRRAPVL